MSVIIESVRWINFLSTGNIETCINITDARTTLIAGENGSGKSTIMDALTYCLFKKAFRKINLPQLINAVTGKNMFVEVMFKTNGRNYCVRRGMKPNIFQIWQDGLLINQNADTRDYQKMLEQTILKMSYKTFCQIVVLGSANFTPFMQLAAAQRREIIEDLLDIQVFSLMNVLLKNRMASNKDSITAVDYRIEMLENNLELQRKHKKELEKLTQEYIESQETRIREIQDKIDANEKKVEEGLEEIEVWKVRLEGWNIIKDRLASANSLQNKLESAIRKAKKEISFYSDTISCPTCKQGITEDFKASLLFTYAEKLEQFEGKINRVQDIILENAAKEKAYQEIQENISKIQRSIAGFHSECKAYASTIKAIRKEMDGSFGVMEIDDEEESRILRDIQHENQRKASLLEEREIHNIALMMLKDGGIKTQIIKQYIPIMNTLINKYLDQMEFFCRFEIDEQFEEVIRARHRDEFSYDSFSQGERMRIDLALLFSWREIARMRNSASINLLILDEIMDSSLDADGTDEFSRIIGQLTEENNVIVISHKSDQIQDRFDRIIRFKKEKNFSRIDE